MLNYESFPNPFNYNSLNLSHVRDLEYFEGPLMSEFISEDGTSYIHHWCDCDGDNPYSNNKVNRWLVFKTTPELIESWENMEVGQNIRTVFRGMFAENIAYIVDINGSDVVRAWQLGIDEIPDTYIPADVVRE